MNTKEFYDELFKFAEGKTYIWSLPRKETFVAADADDFERIAQKLDGEQSIYFSPGLTEKDFGRHERAKTDDIIGIPALWVDVDIKGPGHKSDKLPPDKAAAMSILPANLPPSIVVYSGGGIHAYWLLREVLETRTPEDRAFAGKLLRRLQNAIRAKATENGWILDPTASVEHIFRVPGTVNRKNGAVSKCYVIDADTNCERYNLSDFDDLPEISEVAAAERRETGFERRETDAPAVYQIENCPFARHWKNNFKTLQEPVWKAACGNILRGVGGREIVVAVLKEWLGDKFDPAKSQKILDRFLSDPPQGCDHICNTLGYDCGKCNKPRDLKSPNSWSTSPKHAALALIRRTSQPTNDFVFKPEFVDAMILVSENYLDEWGNFRDRCRLARINLRDIERAIKKRKRDSRAADVPAEATTQDFIESCPLPLKIPRDFDFAEDGVYETRETKEGNTYKSRITGTPTIISKSIFNIDTQERKFEIQYFFRNEWRTFTAKASDVLSAQTVVNFANRGLNISSANSKKFVEYIQELETENQTVIPELPAVSKLGWRDDDEFILPSLPNSKYIIDTPGDGGTSSGYKLAGSFDDWLDLANRLRAESTAARFVLDAAFAAPLLNVLNERNFMVFLCGISGGGKTAALTLAQSVWGDPEKLMNSFYATRNGLERRAQFSNDFPLVVNERQVILGNKDNKQDMLESIVYMLGEGRGKERASTDGMRETATWRTIILANGEEPIARETSKEGVATRILNLEHTKSGGKFLTDKLCKDIYGLTKRNHGHAGAKFIQMLQRKGKDLYPILRNERDKIVDAISERHPRRIPAHVDTIALVGVAEYLFCREFLGLSDADAHDQAWTLADTVLHSMPATEDVSEITHAIQVTRDWFGSNIRRFVSENTIDGKITPIYGHIVSRDNFCYIYPSILSNMLVEAGFTQPQKIVAGMARRGFIDTSKADRPGRYVTRALVNKQRKLWYKIDLRELGYFEAPEDAGQD